MTAWAPVFGATREAGGTRFRVWAPEARRVDLVVERGTRVSDAVAHPSDPGSNASRALPWIGAALRDATVGQTLVRATQTLDIRPLARDADGTWDARFEDVGAGAWYRYRLDDDAARTFPDPASRYQPLGVHGPSEVIDAAAYAWRDREWAGVPMESLILYELHVGTFTEGGTFTAVADRLPALQALGVTAIELMPIGDFPGDRNWGYDGVAPFAPARCYGRPDDLRRLVDLAHGAGLAVFLDVVYNHFGPDGAYAVAFSPAFLSATHDSPWGRALNFDGPQSDLVRRFFIDNAVHWCREYHVDGLRLDATHAIVDERRPLFLQELTTAVRAAVPRPVHLIAEDHRNLTSLVTLVDRGGCGLDAVWADDFHHEVRVHLTHDRDGYYADYGGTTADLATTIGRGWLFTGQWSSYLGVPRGTDPAGLRPGQFVVCLQNHDQVGNRAYGDRLHHDVDPAAWRAASVLLLTVPETPLLFMGQEWAASTPFQYFTDHHQALGREVTEGRRREFRGFDTFQGREGARPLPDPQDAATFEASVLRWTERETGPHAFALRLYERLLRLRRGHAALRTSTWAGCAVTAIDASTIAMWRQPDEEAGVRQADPEARGGRLQAARGDGLLIIVRLDGGATVAVPLATGGGSFLPRAAILTTEDADVSADDLPIAWHVDGDQVMVTFTRPGAIVLSCAS